jgi:FKBP-type peptidyl-prolyl cis-trans isomerase 2
MKSTPTLFLAAVLLLATNCSNPAGGSRSSADTVFLDSGVKYVLLEKGEGTAVDSLMEITTHINLMVNGDQDTAWSTYAPGQREFSFVAKKTSLIQGFDEVVMYAREGDRLLAIIPPRLGYGARGSGAAIPPNATLYFDIDFLKVRAPRQIGSDVMFDAWKDGGVEAVIGTYESIKDSTELYKIDDQEWYQLSVYLANSKAWDDIVAMWDYKLNEGFLLGGYFYKARAYDSLNQISNAIAVLEEAVEKDSTQNPNIKGYLETLRTR